MGGWLDCKGQEVKEVRVVEGEEVRVCEGEGRGCKEGRDGEDRDYNEDGEHTARVCEEGYTAREGEEEGQVRRCRADEVLNSHTQGERDKEEGGQKEEEIFEPEGFAFVLRWRWEEEGEKEKEN